MPIDVVADLEYAPRTRPPRVALLGLITTVLVLSSVAPFVRFGRGLPSLSWDDVGAAGVYVATWLPLLGTVAAFEQSALSGRPARAIAGHLVLLVTLPALHAAIFVATIDAIGHRRSSVADTFADGRVQVLTMLGTLQYLVLVAVAAALRAGRTAEESRRRAMNLELSKARLASELAQVRMDVLRAQLRPHFLFNTLNSIAVLAATQPDDARVMVRRLSELLRAVLADDARPTVPLQRELELLRAYVAIQQVRFGERVRVEIASVPNALDVPVPPLLLQPLVENAIEHAIGDRPEGGTISVRADVVRERDVEHLTLSVTDDGPGFRGGDAGVGLGNTRDRLQTLYGAAHRFTVAPSAGGGCEVRIDLPASGPVHALA